MSANRNQFTNLFEMLCILLAFLMQNFIASGQIRNGDGLRKKIDSLNRIAFDKPVQVAKTADSLIAASKQKNLPIDYGLLLMVKGIAETSLGHNDKALQYHMKAYRIFDSIGNTEGKVFSLSNLGTVYLNLDNYVKAQDYLFKALAIADKKDANNLKTLYVNLGVSFDYAGNYNKALVYYSKAIPYMVKLHDSNGMAINYHNMAVIYSSKKDFKNSEKYELMALQYQKQSRSKSSLAMISLALGDLYVKNKKLAKAKKYIDIGRDAAFELHSPYYKEFYYISVADWYKASGDYKNQGIFLHKLLDLRDTIHSKENLEINTKIEGQFQNDLKTKEIQLLRIQKKLDASKIEKNRFWSVALLIISLLCVAIIFVLYRNYKLKQKANRLLSREKSELKTQNLQLENENILVQFETLRNQVSPHFLFNSLNALSSLIKTDANKAVEFTNVFSKIFRSVLDLKDRHLVTLSEELQHVNSYLYLQKMRFGDNLIFDIRIPSESMGNYLPPFALQMIVENAVKHNSISAETPLHIKIGTEGKFLIITNNLQPRKFVEDSTGTGLENIRSRYKYMTALLPVFEIKNNEYWVKLPLIKEE